MSVKIALGAEYDDELRNTILDVLREMGARQESKSSGVGGSQNVEAVTLRVGSSVIVVEAETYLGLSLSGDSILVHEVASRVRKRLPRLNS